jgi:hypothetical protein
MRTRCAALLVLVMVAATATAQAVTHTTLTPQAAGTVRLLPFLNIFETYSTTDIYSTCFNTNGTNLEFRRGFMEFAIPTFRKNVDKATLVISDVSGTFSSAPTPPDVHEVSYYAADLQVDTSDYDAPATPIGTFETSINDNPDVYTIEFDVTQLVSQFQGANLGFRIKLQGDPQQTCNGGTGAYFGGLFFYSPILKITSRGTPGPQ